MRADEVRLEVAQYDLQTNQLEAARTLCQQIASRSGNLLARKLLYRLHEAFNEQDKALEVLEGIVKDAPSDVEQRRLLAAAYQARQEFAKAVPHMEAAIQIGGGEVEDYLALGELLLRSQLYEKLVQLSQRSLKLFPEQAMFHVHAGLAHRALEHLEPAIASFAAAAELAEGGQSELANHRFYFLYGVTLERGGRHEEAGRVLEKAITLAPKDDAEQAASTMNYLGYMWLELGRYLEKAGELIRKANELHPNSAAYIDSLGWWYYKTGDYKKALSELQRAIALIPELQPEDAEIVEHLGHVYLKLNEPEKAREQFQKALSLGPTDAKVRKRIEEALNSTGAEKKP